MAIQAEDIKKLKKVKRLKHKYKAVRCEADGIKFPSKLERAYYYHLKRLQGLGEVVFFLRQVAFDLPGKIRYVCDFQVFYANGDISFIDTKGRDTPMSIAKRKMVEDLYPIEIEIVKSIV